MTRFIISCPKPAAPSGGVYMLFKMAELLNRLGHTATVQMVNAFSPDWLAYYPSPDLFTTGPLTAGSEDIVIIPETLWPQAPKIYMLPGARRVMFLQNFIWLDKSIYLQSPGDTIVCSRFLWNYARRELKANVIGKFTPYLEEDVWKLTDKERNKVLVMGRRNDYHQSLVKRLLDDGYTVDYVTEPITQRQISEKLETCEYYTHLVHPEGFPMACLEAMRSGTVVVGTTGGGGNELFSHDYSGWVVQDPENGRYGDPDEFISRIMEGLNHLRDHEEDRNRIRDTAYEWSLRYNADAGLSELQEIFGGYI